MTASHSFKKKAIALIGMRGAGKTTVARQLAGLLNAQCLDTDEQIQRESGKTIVEIFANVGEAEFRRREREVIASAVSDPPAVISLGGGAILDARNHVAIAAVAHIVYLRATAEELWGRIANDQSSAATRPALTAYEGAKEVETLLQQREPIYRRVADLVIDTANRTPGDTAEFIVAHFGLQRSND